MKGTGVSTHELEMRGRAGIGEKEEVYVKGLMLKGEN